MVLMVLGVVLRQCSEQMFGTDSVRNSVPSQLSSITPVPGDLYGRQVYQDELRDLLQLPAPLQDPNFELQGEFLRSEVRSSRFCSEQFGTYTPFELPRRPTDTIS